MTYWWCHVRGMSDSWNRTGLHLSQLPTGGVMFGACLIPEIELACIYPNDLLVVSCLGHALFFKYNCWPPFITMTCWWSWGWGIPDSSNRTAGLYFLQRPTDCYKAGASLIPQRIAGLHLSQWPTGVVIIGASLNPETELLACIYPSDLLVLSWLGHVWILKQNCWLAFIQMTYLPIVTRLGHPWFQKQNCWIAFISIACWVYSANDSTSTVLLHHR